MTAIETRAPARTSATVVLATIATIAALYATHWFFVPVALGVTLAAVLLPIVKWLRRIHFPAPLAATVSVLGAMAIIFGVGAALEPPIRGLGAELPRNIATARNKLATMGGPLRRIVNMGRGGAPPAPTPASSTPSASGTTPQPAPQEGLQIGSQPGSQPASTPQPSSSGGPDIMGATQRAFGIASSLLGEIVEVVLLALFLLSAMDGWYAKLASAVPDPTRRQAISDTVGDMRSVVGRYFVVTVAINAVQAIVIALALWLLGYPSPFIWGVLTFLLEFIPYVGGLIMVALLLVVGLASGQSVLHAFLGPAVYLAVTTLQNNLVSPIAYGRGLRLNPAALLLGLIFFWGLWGVAGAFLAVPLLAALQVVASRVDSLRPIAVFLSD